jgi:hypothetical protein
MLIIVLILSSMESGERGNYGAVSRLPGRLNAIATLQQNSRNAQFTTLIAM